MNDFKYINYDNCISNLVSSIAKHYNVTLPHKTLPILDEVLNKHSYKNIVTMVFDAMGSYVLKKNASCASFILENKIADISCVYPSTTVACTTSFLTGYNPIETGWMGWSIYLKPLDKTVDIFLNCESDNKQQVSESCASFIPFTPIGEEIKKKNPDVSYYTLMPSFAKDGYPTLEEGIDRLISLCNDSNKKYIYFYCDEPDATMHLNGIDGPYAKNQISRINSALLKLKDSCPDTLFIISADHGQVNVNSIALYTYYDLIDTFRQTPSLDGRTTAFFIKEGQKEKFKSLFLKNFKNKFLLLSKEEVLEKKIFGVGKENELSKEMLGDFVSFAVDKYYFRIYEHSHYFKGHHAGLLRDEMIIPLIIIENK